MFIDTLLGITIYACGAGTGFAVAKVASVLVGVGLNVILVPVFQERFGNGGIAVVVVFALSEIVVFGGALLVLRRGTLGLAAALDVLRALAAAGLTLLAFHTFRPSPGWTDIPVCIGVFGVASVTLGLVRRTDISALWALARRRGSRETPGERGSARGQDDVGPGPGPGA